MKQVVDDVAEDKAFMGSVLVAKGDTIRFETSRGWANAEWKVAHTAHTKFRLGSVTKQFTAAAILLLEEQGKLSVDDPISKFIPNAPEAWKPVTIRQLLNHTGGVPSFTDFPEYGKWKLSPLSPAEVMTKLADKPLTAPPGQEFRYSNTGYILLGWIVELASGQPYATYVRDHVFQPLGMSDSGYDSSAEVLPERAAGYVNGPNGLENAPYIDMHIPGGAGALYSTTHDLLKWTQGLFGGRLLSGASLTKMTTPAKQGYGFGIGIGERNGRKLYAHEGGIEGFNTYVGYYPDAKLTVVVLQNINGAPGPLAEKLAALAFGDTVMLGKERHEIDLAASVLERYTGVYRMTPTLTNTIRLRSGHLTAQITGQPEFRLFAESEKKFFLKVAEAECEFTTDAQGRATDVTLYQNGHTLKAPRIGDLPASAPIADPEPEVTATVRKIFVDAQAGRFDRALYTPELASVMEQQIAQDPAPSRQALGRLGALQSIELLSREAKNGGRHYQYRLAYEHGAIAVSCFYDGAGQIAGLRFVPE
jgi:CubicO group peptidase (beta-lactamase class C family)